MTNDDSWCPTARFYRIDVLLTGVIFLYCQTICVDTL